MSQVFADSAFVAALFSLAGAYLLMGRHLFDRVMAMPIEEDDLFDVAVAIGNRTARFVRATFILTWPVFLVVAVLAPYTGQTGGTQS
ncbi:hypothetical protein [Zavarzinia sp. CC-PAN008]|uniref:hypothetical protein n=1 Tax=Zavarzinia sp. CC-PAN008 TaxID=3243332 RepID=UPI003F74A47A